MTQQRIEAIADLLPCPFCGAPALLEECSDHHGEWFNLGCTNHWDNCKIQYEKSCPGGRIWYTADPDEKQKAIKAWNTRTSTAEIERLRGENAEYNSIFTRCRDVVAFYDGSDEEKIEAIRKVLLQKGSSNDE